jgi:hypothetical protein
MFRPSVLARLATALSLTGALALAGCASSGSSSSGSPTTETSAKAVSARTAEPEAKAVAARTAEPETTLRDIETPRSQPTRTGEVYLMRGLMDIFSRGMDEMAAKINRAGVYAISTSYTRWQELAEDIVRRDKAKQLSYPIIIMGHSLGANDASKLASYLGNRGVKVSYVVMFDPTEPGYVGKNVGKVVNYYIPNGDNRVYKGNGFTGTLQNVSVANREEITHTTIEKNRELQNRVIGQAIALTKPRPKTKDAAQAEAKAKPKAEKVASADAKPKAKAAEAAATTAAAPKKAETVTVTTTAAPKKPDASATPAAEPKKAAAASTTTPAAAPAKPKVTGAAASSVTPSATGNAKVTTSTPKPATAG